MAIRREDRKLLVVTLVHEQALIANDGLVQHVEVRTGDREPALDRVRALPATTAVRIDHVSDITGLEYSTTYTAYVHAVDEWNRAATATVTFTTGPMLDQSQARTSGTSIFVDDRPFFPTAVWEQCSDMFNSNINDGINLFMGDGCQDESDLPARLSGRA